MRFTEFEARQKFVDIPVGRIAYVEIGSGPVPLFLHGRLLNGYFWRHQIRDLSDIRRCIAIDLMGHGATRAESSQNMSYDRQATMIRQFLDDRQIDSVDLVGNDSGNVLAELFTVNTPKRVRTLTITDASSNPSATVPEEFFKSISQGALRGTIRTLTSRRDIFRSDKALGLGYDHADKVTDETIDAYLEPFLLSPERLSALERFCEATLNCETTVQMGFQARELYVPTLMVGAEDNIHFGMKWPEWLSKAIPGTRRRVEFKDARAYFPEERWGEFNDKLRNYWTTMSLQALAMWARIP